MGTRSVAMPPSIWGLLGCCFLCDWALGGPRPLHSLPPLSSQVKPGSEPRWLPQEGAEAALAFLYSGDAQQLSGANCSEHYEAQGAGARLGLPPILWKAAVTLAQAANFLNMLLQANDIRESSVEEDMEWYQALVRSVAEGDLRAYRALLTFNPPPGASHLQLALQATRVGEETILQDLSKNRRRESPTGGSDTPALQKRVLTNDLGSLGSPKWPRGDGYVGDMQHVRLSPPFLECQEGRLRPGWLITLSTTFYGLAPDLSPEVRGQVQMDVDLQSVNVNQCASGPGWYANTHMCELNSTQCVPLEGQGFVLGRYLCRCRPGFYGASHSGGLEESATQPTGQFGSLQSSTERLLRCQPCPKDCTSCTNATPCLVEEALVLRALVLACQACCMLAVLLSMLLFYRCRRSKRIRASGVVLLETILLGSLLLYFPVFILYFKPSVFCCIALRWVRLLGFAIVYGTIVLKLYRVLQLFLSQMAQRVSHLSSRQLLQRLGLLLLLVLGFLLVWTAGVLEPGQHTPLVTQGQTPAGRRFHLCHHGHWDYVMVVAEMLLLCWGSFLCYAGRAVPAALHEPRHLGIALHNELLLSSAFHAARFVLVPSLHPDWTLLLFFFHTHITVTVTLALIFIPKFRKLGAPSREEMVDEAGEDELDLQLSGSYLNSSIASAWSEHSLDPGDIRDELKKLYAQLEAYKTKEMAANNPHLPKKRGGSRQGLGRSFMRYLAEFPEALAWQHSQDSPGRSSMPGSSRHRLLSSSLQEPQWKPALRKSRSTYEHDQGREQDLPLLNSLLRSKLAKKASRESRESVEEPPVLGFRSISAHNLTVGEKLLRAPPTSLQKSLSVVAGSREKALLVASQAFLEETYRQAKEQEERKMAEAAMASPVWRPSARRLEQAQGAPLSAPLSPAKSSSVDSPPPSGKLQEDTVKRLPHPPIMHQVPTPILALSGPCLGEPHMLSPTSTLAPALMAAPGPSLAPIPVSPQGPSVLTYICPWEDTELPVKKENVARKDPSGPEQGNHPLAPARAKLWRALSIAAEKRGGEENGMDVGDGHLQTDEDRPKIISKSHSLKTQQGSMRSLGLAIKALTRSRSTYREKESGKVVPGGEKGRASGEGAGACPQSPRPGRPRAVSKQTALAPSDDEESLQNQQNAHTSRMLQVCHQEGTREQDDRGRRTPQSLGEERAERAVRAGPAPLRQVRQNTVGDRTTERAKAAPIGGQELPKSGRQSLGSADSCVAEVCPWEATELETCLPDSSNKAEICPWEVSEGTPESRALRRDLQDSQEERGKAPEKSEPKDVAAIARKKPERLVKRQEAVCPRENAGPGGLSPPDCDKTKGRSEAGRSVEAREIENAGLSQQKLKTFFCKEQKSDGDLEFHCPWERTDFRGPSAISTQVPRTAGDPGCLSTSVVEVCPWKAGDTRAVRKTEICPWELGDEVAGKEVLGNGTGGESLQGMGSSEEKVGQTGKAAQELSHWQESACPWEDTAPGHSSPCLDSASSRAGGLSQGGSRATQGCPQENLRPGVTPARAETCPWKVGERIREDWTAGWASGEDSQEGQEKMPGTLGIKDATTWEKQEAVCPWESVDPDSFSPRRAQNRERPKASFQASGLVGSKIAEICPWDVEGILPGEKAEICPWEAGTGAGEQRALGVEATSKMPDHVGKAPAAPGPSEVAVPAPKEPERPAQEQEVGCPWESMGPRGSSQHSDTGRPEVGFQELDHVGYRRAEVCPWEVEEAPASEKAQTCPWELSEVATGKGLEEGVGSDSAGQREKTLEKGRLTSLEDLSKWEKKQSLNQEAIGPWGKEPRAQVLKVADLPSPSNRGAEGCCLEVSDEASEGEDLRQDPQMNGGIPEHVTQEKAPSKAREFTAEDEKDKSIQFQAESMAPAGSLSSTEQGEAGSQRLVSVEGRMAEACAVEAPALDVPAPDSGARAETLCLEDTERLPGRGLSTHHGKGDSPEKGKALEKPEPKVVAVQEMPERAGRKQEAGCLQESQDCGGLSPQAAPQACDRSRGSSEAADGMRTSGAQVCPWEAEEAPFTKKAEICPWEVRKEAADTGELEQEVDRDSQEQGGRFPQKAGSGGAEGHFSKEVAQVSREQETVCLREGTDYGEEDSPDTDQPKVSLCGARSMVSKMAELCQWEITNPEGNKIKGTMADICPWEGTGGSSEESGLLLLTGTQTEIFSPTAPEKPPCLLVHRPPGSFLLESKSPHPEVSKSANTSLEGVKGLQGPSALGTGTSLATDSSLQEAEAQKSSSLTEEQEVVSKVPCEEVPHQQSILSSGSDSSIK